jgi:hypothetical protein
VIQFDSSSKNLKNSECESDAIGNGVEHSSNSSKDQSIRKWSTRSLLATHGWIRNYGSHIPALQKPRSEDRAVQTDLMNVRENLFIGSEQNINLTMTDLTGPYLLQLHQGGDIPIKLPSLASLLGLTAIAPLFLMDSTINPLDTNNATINMMIPSAKDISSRSSGNDDNGNDNGNDHTTFQSSSMELDSGHSCNSSIESPGTEVVDTKDSTSSAKGSGKVIFPGNLIAAAVVADSSQEVSDLACAKTSTNSTENEHDLVFSKF